MSSAPATLGILVTAPPETPAFRAFLDSAGLALRLNRPVYAYLLHDAVSGLHLPAVQNLRQNGLILHACALAADRRHIPNSDLAVFSGLVTLGELIARCDEFQTFSPKAGS